MLQSYLDELHTLNGKISTYYFREGKYVFNDLLVTVEKVISILRQIPLPISLENARESALTTITTATEAIKMEYESTDLRIPHEKLNEKTRQEVDNIQTALRSFDRTVAA